MAFANTVSVTDIEDAGTGALDILDKKNALTTAGIVTAAGGVVTGGLLLTAALPVQTITIVGASAALLYAGDRKAKGLSVNPFMKEVEAKVETVVEAVAEATAA